MKTTSEPQLLQRVEEGEPLLEPAEVELLQVHGEGKVLAQKPEAPQPLKSAVTPASTDASASTAGTAGGASVCPSCRRSACNGSAAKPCLSSQQGPGAAPFSIHTSGSVRRVDASVFTSSVSVIGPMCRFCFCGGEACNPLIAPCRCTGSVRYVHHECLMKWLQVRRKRPHAAPRCELCKYEFQRHKEFQMRDCRLPSLSTRDKVLHSVFVISLCMMVACAVATILSFTADKARGRSEQPDQRQLQSDVVTLVCSVLFFVAFFFAMTSQLKAHHSVYQVMTQFMAQTVKWRIEDYKVEKSKPATRAPGLMLGRALAPASSLPSSQHPV